MMEFATDIEAARNCINMHIIDDAPNSPTKYTLLFNRGDARCGNRGVTSVMKIGNAIAQLRNAAGLTPGQVSVTRGDDCVRIETTMDNWNKLRAYVKPVERGTASQTR